MSFRNCSSIWDIFIKPQQSLQYSESIRTYKGLCHHHVLYTKCWFWIANKCSNFLRKKKKKKNKLWGQEDEWIECQRLCSSSVDGLQLEVTLELKWNWWSCLGRQEAITNLWPHTYRHHGRQLNHTHVAQRAPVRQLPTKLRSFFFPF